jgi:hypothetical protein
VSCFTRTAIYRAIAVHQAAVALGTGGKNEGLAKRARSGEKVALN